MRTIVGEEILFAITMGDKMRKVYLKTTYQGYYETEDSILVLGDSFEILRKMKSECFDMILDPPYF